MSRSELKVAGIVLVSLAVGFVLAGGTEHAQGQSEGRTSGVICVVGVERNHVAPIVVLDVPEQTFMVYQYTYIGKSIELVGARTYRYDRLLQDFGVKGVTVEEVRQEVSRRQ